MRQRASWTAAVVTAVLVGTGGAAVAKFMHCPQAPVTRLLANVAKALEKSPDDAHLLYLKGRTHAIAYAQGESANGHCESSGGRDHTAEPVLPTFGTRDYDLLQFKGEADDTRLAHLRDGIRCLRRGSDLANAPEKGSAESDDRPLLFLGLAWLLDDGSRFSAQAGHPEGVEPKDALTEVERAEIDARIARLGAQKEDERKAAFDALRRSLPRCWQRLVVQKGAKAEAVRSGVKALLTRWWQDQALDAYRKALALTREEDAKDDDLRDTYTISREAGNAILRLQDATLGAEAAARERADVERHLKTLDARGKAVTPIVFPISRPGPLTELLPAGRRARFDLAGDGIVRSWPWPSAEAGLLAWAPDLAKPITSGRQLFGARTWWIFWRDGYEPLSMLDDDADGRLAGAELDGIGVWRDLDGNGRSDAGEVVSASAHGIAWIAVRATRTEDGVPATDRGIGLLDGTTRPTYDWTPRPIPEPRAQNQASETVPTSADLRDRSAACCPAAVPPTRSFAGQVAANRNSTIACATSVFVAAGNVKTCPFASSMRKSARVAPSAEGPSRTTASRFFAKSFLRARASASSICSAKPTTRRRAFVAASSARMSGFGTRSSVTGPPVFSGFPSRGAAGR